MKKFVINLTSRPDRKQKFMQNNPHLTDVQWFTAADGSKISLSDIRKIGFDVDINWRDPFKNRKLLRGEVGCFLSHYVLWQICAEINQPILILEDDAIVSPDFVVPTHIDYDLLYLGYNENSPDKVKYHSSDDNFVYPAYPYNAHAYIITPAFARELIKNTTIIPVDELLALNINDFLVVAFRNSKASQVPRSELASDIEPRGPEDIFNDYQQVHVLTVGTDRLKLNRLNDSAANYGIYPKNLGNNVQWNGGDMQTQGGMQKLHLLANYLKDVPPTDIILFTDGYDVFYTDTLETIVERYFGFNTQVLFAAESNCWPDESLATSYPETHTDYRYLNSGCFIGRAGALQDMLSSCFDFEPWDDDQLYLTKKYLELSDNTSLVQLDVEHYIFNVGLEAEVNIESGQLRNPVTNCTSCIYHGAGGPSVKQFTKQLYTQFAPPSGFQYIPNLSAIEYLSADMMVVDFINQSQCENLIDLAEELGQWNSLPNDTFPAQEIRLKELNLYQTFQKKWEEHLYPIVEKYWYPLKMYGLRDAFIMKYTRDTQTSLPLHHDASLVTGSVKLNEDYVGGILEFPRQNVNNLDVPVGKCILFPGQVTHPHQSNELVSGTKYSLTMWTSRYSGDLL